MCARSDSHPGYLAATERQVVIAVDLRPLSRCTYCYLIRMNCVFCNLASSGVDYMVFENDDLFVIPDRDSLGYGHVMIVPKEHVAKVYNLDGITYRRLFELAKLLSNQLELATSKRAVAYTAFGSGLPHAHLHLVPHDDDSVLLTPAKYATRKTVSELRQMAVRLREQLDLSSSWH